MSEAPAGDWSGGDEPGSLAAARAAKAELVARYAADARVVGIGIAPDGRGGYEVKINVTDAEASWELPAEQAGVTVRMEIVGAVRPL